MPVGTSQTIRHRPEGHIIIRHIMTSQDIYIRNLDPTEFWEGQFVMSAGNDNHIYRILLTGSGPHYQCWYRISDPEKPNLHKIDRESPKPVYYNTTIWIETTITRNLNLQLQRERKLNLLGI